MKLKLHRLAIAATGLLCLVGCSEGPIKTVPVYGTVTFVDRERPMATDLVFKPVKVEGLVRPSFANTESDGSYRVKAFPNSKGLIPGTYHVLLTMHDVKPGTDQKVASNWKTSDYDGGEVQVPADSGGIEFNIEVQKKE